MRQRIISITVLIVVVTSGSLVHYSDGAKMMSPVVVDTCSPIPPPPCRDGASPGVIQLVPDGSSPANKLKLARKRFYLSSCPFNLANSVSITTAPTLRNLYNGVGASAQLIGWLEENHCETIYCRELTIAEATCEGIDSNKCVPEFISAYRNALANLKSNATLAVKMITNYPPLSDRRLRIGFYEARAQWLKNAVSAMESRVGSDYRMKTTVTDKDGVGFFYELCPGTYYISSIAPIDVDGVDIIWETAKPIKVEGPPDVKTATRVTLAFPPNKDKKNYFVGKPVTDFTAPKPATQ